MMAARLRVSKRSSVRSAILGLAILRAGDAKEFDCEDIADLLVEKL